ncbi:MAG: hypothetical protein PHP23_04835 [Desulfobacterales bacterium]|nr:hypothetical protein [Desulfobacterales bacterium]MDD4072777.1 hypothetical protein [Desulfobacterales bacterium]MDD4392074.1 hypothetical protein [Desulfobacterales bacterium]
MDIICDQCQYKLQIPDEKINQILPGKVATVSCPKCKSKITIQSPRKTAHGEQATPEGLSEGGEPVAYDASDKPFDFIEEEGQTALVCESDPNAVEKIQKTLDQMEYHLTVAENLRDVLKKVRYHTYDLIMVDENFDTRNPDSNGVLTYLERLNPSIRRKIFVVLISSRYRTMDNMMAFNKSVNLIINSSNLDDLEKILSRSITENEFFYRVFNDMLKKKARA